MKRVLPTLTLLLALGAAPARAEAVSQPDPSADAAPSREAAEPEGPDAQFQRGFDLIYGHGVPQDPAAGNVWIRKAAEQGHTRAEVVMGMSYLKGRGIEQDNQKALEWLRKAAEKNHPKAQMELGLAYRDGTGVEPDPVVAMMWLALAAQNGGLAPRLMAPAHARRLSPEQREQAREMVKQWRVAHGMPEQPTLRPVETRSDTEVHLPSAQPPPGS